MQLTLSCLASTLSRYSLTSTFLTYIFDKMGSFAPSEKSETEIQNILDRYAAGLKFSARAPIIHQPSEAGLKYEEIFFPSYDGVPLEGWFIPCHNSTKLIICNHPSGFTRAGHPSHLEPWRSIFAATGNTIEVNFVPDYRILHDAGYNVLTYDLRNFGQSGPANSGLLSGGKFEARDVIGSIIYARSRPDTEDMTIGLLSRCLGFTASLWAMHLFPKFFEDGNVRCLAGPQPISAISAMERNFERDGVPIKKMEQVDKVCRVTTSFGIHELGPRQPAKSTSLPTFVYQVRDDAWTKPEDVQIIFDNMPVSEKKLHWIEGSTRRWDGYLFF
ncbi:hypothetical protein LTR70_002889 [Exophiala xenobiotica]|nr:hypothetical protein LTR70_002889 [Exophiala xenobiotica]